MIAVKLNEPEFEYDIHSLIRAFYPGENVRVTAEDEKYDGEITLFFQIEYGAGRIAVSWSAGGGAGAQPIAQNGDAQGTLSVQTVKTASDCVRPAGFAQPIAQSPRNGEGQSGRRFADVSGCDRKETKNRLKRLLYEILSGLTGETLPWGTLTGIRPTKIPMKLLAEGKTDDEIRAYMRETYFASEGKINLSIAIAKRERALLEKIDYENGYSLYIGIPFCPTTCLYCSFTSYPLAVWRGRVDEYLDALEREMDFVAVKFAGRRLNSVYIGGGTPTTLEPYQLDRLLRKIRCSFDLSGCLEITVEAGRPDSITREKLETLKKWDVTRISVNPQTMKDETLKIIGRRHTVAQTIASFALAREVGFDDINMDLIMGLPGESLSDVRDTLEQILALRPDNLTVHSLALKRAARLNIFRDDYKDYEMVNTAAHMDLVAEYAGRLGLSPYYLYRQKSMAGNLENVGYAAPGKAGVYNVLIMEEVQSIVALGAGSITKRVYGDGRIERCDNVKDVGQYIDRIGEMIERKRKLFEE